MNRGGVSAALSSVADNDKMWLDNLGRLNSRVGGTKAVQVRIALKMKVRTRVGLAGVMFREVWGAPMVLLC